MLDLGIWVIIAALVGAKGLLFIVDFEHFTSSREEFFSLLRSGGVFYGGLIAASLTCIYQLRKHKLPLWKSGDLFAPGIALGYMVGRLGCFMAGCCYGKPTQVAWAVTFTDPAAAMNVGTPLGVPLHPTQMYESLAGLVILVVAARPPSAAARPTTGGRSGASCFLYGVSRFVIEFFRGDDRGMAGMFSTSQLISLVLVPLSVVMLWWLRRPADAAAAGDARSSGAGRSRPRLTQAAAEPSRRRASAMPQSFAVAEEHEGLRLDKFLAGEVPNHSRAQIQRLIDEGCVRLPRLKAVKANSLVRTGDTVTVEVPEAAPTDLVAEDLPLDILYDDADVVVVNKPAGLVVHPGAGHASGTLVHALLHHVKDLSGIGGEQRPGIVHRLDKGTSGVMVVAKHDQAHQELARQFHDREVDKEYVALVWGVVHNRRRIDLPLGRDPGAPREDFDPRPARPPRRHPRDLGAPAARRHADPRRHRHRPHPPDPRAPERDRARHRRRLGLRRRPCPGRPRHPRRAAAHPALPARRADCLHPSDHG